jgi:hypothetical protein
LAPGPQQQGLLVYMDWLAAGAAQARIAGLGKSELLLVENGWSAAGGR